MSKNFRIFVMIIYEIEIFIHMKNKKHMIGNMLFKDYNKLSYKEQCEYISSLKPIVCEVDEKQGEQVVEIDSTIDDYIKEHNLISLEELREHMKNIEDKSQKTNEPNQPNA